VSCRRRCRGVQQHLAHEMRFPPVSPPPAGTPPAAILRQPALQNRTGRSCPGLASERLGIVGSPTATRGHGRHRTAAGKSVGRGRVAIVRPRVRTVCRCARQKVPAPAGSSTIGRHPERRPPPWKVHGRSGCGARGSADGRAGTAKIACGAGQDTVDDLGPTSGSRRPSPWTSAGRKARASRHGPSIPAAASAQRPPPRLSSISTFPVAKPGATTPSLHREPFGAQTGLKPQVVPGDEPRRSPARVEVRKPAQSRAGKDGHDAVAGETCPRWPPLALQPLSPARSTRSAMNLSQDARGPPAAGDLHRSARTSREEEPSTLLCIPRIECSSAGVPALATETWPLRPRRGCRHDPHERPAASAAPFVVHLSIVSLIVSRTARGGVRSKAAIVACRC